MRNQTQNPPLNILCFVARQHGLAGLKALLADTKYQVCGVFTHRLTASFEGPNQVERQDYNDFAQLCDQKGIPLWGIDNKTDEAKIAQAFADINNIDILVSISWRRLIKAEHINQARFGGVNLHRGKLPDYRGAYPIQQAIEANQHDVIISAHRLEPVIDSGEVLTTASHPIHYQANQSMHDNIERLKSEITPYFGPLLLASLALLQGQPPKP